jgi:hypothetical protein
MAKIIIIMVTTLTVFPGFVKECEKIIHMKSIERSHTPLRNHPSALLRNHPSALLRNHPSALLRNHPSALLRNHPSALLRNQRL